MPGCWCGMNAAKTAQTVIPQPAQYELTEGVFKVPGSWRVKSTLDKKTTEKLLKALKHNYVLTDSKNKADIDLYLKEDKSVADENYVLDRSEEHTSELQSP